MAAMAADYLNSPAAAEMGGAGCGEVLTALATRVPTVWAPYSAAAAGQTRHGPRERTSRDGGFSGWGTAHPPACR